ncbi:MAG: Fpg/Nei family DNA glycosylase [Solirubrobacterales bacterium]
MRKKWARQGDSGKRQMAEGDTILRAARRIEAALAGEVVSVDSPSPRAKAVALRSLDGKRLEAVGTHGKHLLLDLGDLVLHSHLGMSGAWHVYDHGAAWRKPPFTAWAVLRGERAEAVEFGGPTLRVLTRDALRLDPLLARLGPDVLSPDFDPGPIAALLRSAPEREVGDALLDQRLVAGIGNIFKSEACFAARQDPWQPVGELSNAQLARVAQAAHDLMRDAVDSGRHNHAVYRRAGRPCPSCGTPIRSRGQGDANRTTYWCRVCQARAWGTWQA